MTKVDLGDTVEDTVTGFRGIAIGRHTFLHGATSITVQPIISHYGILPETENFSEASLKTTKTKKSKGPIIVK